MMNKNRLIFSSLIFVLFVLAYLPLWPWMWDRWFAHDSYYTHGILIPLASLYLIWQKREILKNIKRQPSRAGLWIFMLGLLIHVVSLLFSVYFTSAFAMIMVIIGFVLSIFGFPILKVILFPILFLIFMVPLPLISIISISFQLKLLSAQLATIMLNFLNFPAIQQGSYIRMPHAIVIVEDVCSGLRSLIALMALGALFAYLMKSGKLKKIILFLSSIPIAIITNMLRIMILAIIGECWGTKYITDTVHQLTGFFVFVIAFILLSKIEKLLE